MTDLLPCGAPNTPPMFDPDTGETVYPCNCMWCPRCGQHTNSTWFGHHRTLCRVSGEETAPHFCCPGDCDLDVLPVTSPLVERAGAGAGIMVQGAFLCAHDTFHALRA